MFLFFAKHIGVCLASIKKKKKVRVENKICWYLLVLCHKFGLVYVVV